MTAKHLLDQIVLGLDGVTAGPWREDTHLCCVVGHKGEIICGPANCAHIIATQPDAIREIAAYVSSLEESLATATQALEFYANPEIYKPHPHGLAFDQRDVSFCARTALTTIRRTTP